MTTPLRLIHLGNANSTNIGNGALIDGTERILDEDIPRPIIWNREAWDDYTFEHKKFDRSFVDLINASDGLIVNGAVSMNGRWYQPNAGMRVDLPLDLWKEIRKPVIFYGQSHRHWPHQKYHHRDKLLATINTILDHPMMLFAVRNDGTREWLAEFMGIRDDRIVALPDPGMFVRAADGEYPEIRRDRLNVIVALNDEDLVYRFGDTRRRWAMTILEPILGESRALAIAGHLSGAWRTRRRVLRGVATALQTVNRDHKLNIILVPHYFDDYRAMTTLIGEMKPQFAHQQTISTGLATVPHVQWFYGRYCKADLAISMRVHSMSPALGLGVPTIPIVTQRRLSAFLEDAGLSDVAVDAFAPDMADRLVAAIRRSIAAPQERRERALAAKARFREQYRVYNRKVAGLLGA